MSKAGDTDEWDFIRPLLSDLGQLTVSALNFCSTKASVVLKDDIENRILRQLIFVHTVKNLNYRKGLRHAKSRFWHLFKKIQKSHIIFFSSCFSFLPFLLFKKLIESNKCMKMLYLPNHLQIYWFSQVLHFFKGAFSESLKIAFFKVDPQQNLRVKSEYVWGILFSWFHP